MSNYSKPGDERYTVTVSSDLVLIYRYRYAGICGPAQSIDRPEILGEVDDWLMSQGFIRPGNCDYKLINAYDGLLLEADIKRVDN